MYLPKNGGKFLILRKKKDQTQYWRILLFKLSIRFFISLIEAFISKIFCLILLNIFISLVKFLLKSPVNSLI